MLRSTTLFKRSILGSSVCHVSEKTQSMCERNVFKEPKSNEADRPKRAQSTASRNWTGRSDKTEGPSHTKAGARSSHPKLEKGQVHTQSLTNCSA